MFEVVFMINKKIVLLSVFSAWEGSVPLHRKTLLCEDFTSTPHLFDGKPLYKILSNVFKELATTAYPLMF